MHSTVTLWKSREKDQLGLKSITRSHAGTVGAGILAKKVLIFCGKNQCFVFRKVFESVCFPRRPGAFCGRTRAMFLLCRLRDVVLPVEQRVLWPFWKQIVWPGRCCVLFAEVCALVIPMRFLLWRVGSEAELAPIFPFGGIRPGSIRRCGCFSSGRCGPD